MTNMISNEPPPDWYDVSQYRTLSSEQNKSHRSHPSHTALERMRFTLRTLFIGITLVAVALMCWLGYRHATLCRLQWLSPGSPAAKALFPAATIQQLDDGWYSFTYDARSRDIQSLYTALPPQGDRNLQINRQSITIKCREQADAQACLAALQAADKHKPGSFVIRGRVVDRSGNPVARATVDLMGGYVFINYFETRDDGTFTMPLYDSLSLSAPAGRGYYLRVRDKNETADKPIRWNTPSFSLDPATPESDVLVVLPETL